MSTVVEAPRAETEPEPPPDTTQLRDRRILTVVGLIAIYAIAVGIYGFQAWHREVPWIFQDELFHASQAREFAETGETSIRGTPNTDDRVTAWVTSIAWHFDDPETSFLAAKMLNVLLMAAAAFPAFLLARIVVSRPWALFAAAGTVAIPAFVYTSMILTEPLAYLLATTALWLMTRTLANDQIDSQTALWAIAALSVITLGFGARSQLYILYAVFAVAAALRLLLARPIRMRLYLAIPGLVALGAALYFGYKEQLQRDGQFHVVDGFWREIAQFATWGGGALAIGVLVLPAVLGLAALWPVGVRRQMPGHIAFGLVAAVAILALLWYTGIKGAFLHFTFATRVLERNMIYAAPLLMVGTAIFLQYRRLNPFALAGSLALVTYAVYEVPYQLAFRLYSDAPGLAVLSTANRHLQWTDDHVRRYLAVALAAALVIALVPYVIKKGSVLRVGASLLAIIVVAGALTAEVAADRSNRGASAMFADNLPKPYDWIDEETQGERSVFLGTAISDPNGVWLTQFFNPNMWHLATLDGTAPLPGASVTPDIVGADGLLFPQFPDSPYAVVDNKIKIAGEPIREEEYLTLYQVEQPLRLAEASYGVMGDGWMADSASFYQFSSDEPGPGVAKVTVSRAAWGGEDVPGLVQITVKPLRWEGPHDNVSGELVEGLPVAFETVTIHSRQVVEFLIPVPDGPPFVVDIKVLPTFSPADFGLGDGRQLGVQPSVEYLPRFNLGRTVTRELNPAVILP